MTRRYKEFRLACLLGVVATVPTACKFSVHEGVNEEPYQRVRPGMTAAELGNAFPETYLPEFVDGRKFALAKDRAEKFGGYLVFGESQSPRNPGFAFDDGHLTKPAPRKLLPAGIDASKFKPGQTLQEVLAAIPKSYRPNVVEEGPETPPTKFPYRLEIYLPQDAWMIEKSTVRLDVQNATPGGLIWTYSFWLRNGVVERKDERFSEY